MRTPAPTVDAAGFNYKALPHSLTFVFSRDVSGTLSRWSPRVWNLTSNTQVWPTAMHYDHVTDTATFHFAGQVASGQYRATLPATIIADLSGRHLDGDYHFDFFFLVGDINHDGKVDSHDLEILARNYHRRDASYADGDVNYDGVVDLGDLLIIGKNYGEALEGFGSPVFCGPPPRIPSPQFKRHARRRRDGQG